MHTEIGLFYHHSYHCQHLRAHRIIFWMPSAINVFNAVQFFGSEIFETFSVQPTYIEGFKKIKRWYALIYVNFDVPYIRSQFCRGMWDFNWNYLKNGRWLNNNSKLPSTLKKLCLTAHSKVFCKAFPVRWVMIRPKMTTQWNSQNEFEKDIMKFNLK